jgi:hypothetical protein
MRWEVVCLEALCSSEPEMTRPCWTGECVFWKGQFPLEAVSGMRINAFLVPLESLGPLASLSPLSGLESD